VDAFSAIPDSIDQPRTSIKNTRKSEERGSSERGTKKHLKKYPFAPGAGVKQSFCHISEESGAIANKYVICIET
jgi:hypothetical protein